MTHTPQADPVADNDARKILALDIKPLARHMEWSTRYARTSRCQSAAWGLLLSCALQAISAPGFAAELVVGAGPGAAFRLPSAAAAAARPGETIRILPGTYY